MERAEEVFPTAVVTANQPIGEAKGIFPGRVAWVHNANAVNQDCVVNASGHGWFLSENQNQPVVDAMVSTALRNLSGQANDAAAWSSIFRYHNATRGKGAVGYARGEKIFIKINATSAYYGNFNPDDLTPYAYVSETSLASVRAVLRQLVNVVGVDQRDIFVGDPLKHIYRHLYEVWHGEFPNVHYLDNGGYTNLGRETVVPSDTAVVHYSDRGSVLRTNVWANNYAGDAPVAEDHLYTIFDDAEYLINIPMLKGHKRAGVTMFAKNHFGSHTRSDASHLHNGLVAPTEMPNVTRAGYGLYRVQVDLMGHSLLGKKNLIYLMDALWATDYELDVPLKWQMAPFANSYMASIFASLDPVAIESVGYDFLRSEFTADRVPSAGTYVQMNGVDDYLHQAADASNWPSGIRYDPDNAGVPIGSLGVHEHWDAAATKRYSRNLADTGRGIELVSVEETLRVNPPSNAVTRPGGTVTFTAVSGGVAPLSYQWQRRAAGSAAWSDLVDAALYVGATTSQLTVNGVLAEMNGDQFRCVVTDGTGTRATSGVGILTVSASAAGRLVNIAARAYCATGNRVTIGGFVVSGGPKRLLIRAVGPSLSAQGISETEVLRDPTIEIHDASRAGAVIGTNDNWGDNGNATEIGEVAGLVGASAFANNDTTSSALLVTLPAGVYTFVAAGKASTSGTVLVEVYDADAAGAGAALVNISSRAYCAGGNRVTIGGFVVSGGHKTVLVRAVGPSLTAQGIGSSETLSDPVIEVHDASNGNAIIAVNDNWGEGANAAEISAVAAAVGATAFSRSDTTSAALLLTLAPGAYTFVVSGRSNSSGIVLAEVYDVEPP